MSTLMSAVLNMCCFAVFTMVTSCAAHHETLAQENWRCSTSSNTVSTPEHMVRSDATHSMCNASGVHARMDWTSFTLGPSHGAHPVTLNYDGLDPAVTYELSVLFFSSEFKVRVQSSTCCCVVCFYNFDFLPCSLSSVALLVHNMAWSRHSKRNETLSRQGIQFCNRMLFQCGQCVE